MALRRLWEVLRPEDRQQTLRVLSRIVAQQLQLPPNVEEGHHEDRRANCHHAGSRTPQRPLESREFLQGLARSSGKACGCLFGWPRERVLTIDEDQGKSGRTAEGRSGFERLIAEVTLNHVGMVLGLEMSRLARSSKDWHAFFEMCAVFGTLIADQDGVYDGNDPNDRLLLGLKGIMSEMELHIMRSRLERGRDCKAQRGELFFGVPVGYVILPMGEVDFDPDEQAREVMKLIFDKFDELGTVYGVFHWLIRNNIRLPVRPQSGARKGQLDWRRASVATLSNTLHHPIYAGAYSFGRRPTDRKRQFSPKSHSRPSVPMEQWRVLLRDRIPAYITWERYLKNQERIKQNRNQFDCKGVARSGAALLPGVLVCGRCGCRMQTLYHDHGKAQYVCNLRYLKATEKSRCPGIAARALDGLIAQQVLRALEPAAVELSMQAHADVENDSTSTGSNDANGPATMPSWRNAAIRRLTPRTVWWQPPWKNTGRNCLPRKSSSRKSTTASFVKLP